MTADRLRGSDRPLAEDYDAGLLDLDGVVYVGSDAVSGAGAACEGARALGMRLAFVTNNAARTPGVVAAHLRRLGIPCDDDEVVTSAQAAARLLAGTVPPRSSILVVGGAGLTEAVAERGLVPCQGPAEIVDAVVQGYSPEVGWRELAEAAYALSRGVPWVATNGDRTLPTPRGLAPGNGALVAALEVATGRQPVVAGKPELPLHAEAVSRTGAHRPLVVGDRLDTDVEGAVRAGTDSLLVLTGVATMADVLRAGRGQRPTYVARDLTGLLDAHPEPREWAGWWRVGDWTACVRDGRLDVAGDGDPMDGLRAGCAALWAHETDAPELVEVHPAIERLNAGC